MNNMRSWRPGPTQNVIEKVMNILVWRLESFSETRLYRRRVQRLPFEASRNVVSTCSHIAFAPNILVHIEQVNMHSADKIRPLQHTMSGVLAYNAGMDRNVCGVLCAMIGLCKNSTSMDR